LRLFVFLYYNWNMSLQRVSIFIDNSNVFHRLLERREYPAWGICLYDPLYLAQRLAGDRKLVHVGFYCTPPPAYMAIGGEEDKRKYAKTMQYYSLIEKLGLVEIKFGTLKGIPGNLREKNLDTQLVSDAVVLTTQNQFDTAILVSNDGDFVSAARPIKALGKRVEVMYFKGQVSMALAQEADLKRRARPTFFKQIEGV